MTHAEEDRSGLPVAPGMDAGLTGVAAPLESRRIGPRTVKLAGIAILVGVGGGLAAWALLSLIWLITNLVFFHRVSTAMASPGEADIGLWILLVPVLGGVVVGLMARFGSPAIRGHGIPEVMEKVLHGESRIPMKVMFLKPLSAALAMGTGGPFGAEGPIIATGGALGSTIGQLLHITAEERKTLLAAGAASGMAAVFASPVSAVLLSVELLLFEYRARSIVPVALAASAAMGVRLLLIGPGPAFVIPPIEQPGEAALALYVVLGAIMGLAAAVVTKAVYAIEDWFETLPVHWMWWPALGAVVVGVVGYFEPRTLGVGYDVIEAIVGGKIVGLALLFLVVMKFLSWSIYLGSGTSGGTMAPLFIIGGGIGALLGGLVARAFPELGMSVEVAALVGMAAIFAGASHALLASVVLAFEMTRQPLGLLPLLGGCSASYLVMLLLMRNSIMTERLARRGTSVRAEYAMDFLGQVLVKEVASTQLITLRAESPLTEVQSWLTSGAGGASHQGFPVVNASGVLVGVVTRRDVLGVEGAAQQTVGAVLKRGPAVIYRDNTLREAADHMVREGVGRLVVIERAGPPRPLGILTRSDLLGAHERRLRATDRVERGFGRSA